ncbi:ankyrin repeat domain-containing protein [Marinilabiliaceae bacterium ANBcel2]|nr:ankyrin repeat domain-containing protein [Marinilabiliaceae bacterium ANBcel2]
MEHELIFFAGKGNNVNRLRELIENNNIDVNKNLNNTYLLLEAVNNGNEEVVAYLLKKGASKYTLDENGNLPIHIAATNNYLNIFKLLFEKEEDSLLKNEDNLNVIELTILNDSSEIKNYLNSMNIKLDKSKSKELKANYGVLQRKDLSIMDLLIITLYGLFTWRGLLGVFFIISGNVSWELVYGPVYFIVGLLLVSLAIRKKFKQITPNQ